MVVLSLRKSLLDDSKCLRVRVCMLYMCESPRVYVCVFSTQLVRSKIGYDQQNMFCVLYNETIFLFFNFSSMNVYEEKCVIPL